MATRNVPIREIELTNAPEHPQEVARILKAFSGGLEGRIRFCDAESAQYDVTRKRAY